MPLYAGACSADITPPPGVWMGGYAYRSSGCTGIRDELLARALVLDDGVSPLAIVSLDLIGLEVEQALRLRETISAATGIPVAAILVNCSHTHGGPLTQAFLTMGEPDAAYVSVLERKIVGVAVQAAGSVRPARVRVGAAPCQVGINRRQTTTGGTIIGRNCAGPVDEQVRVIEVASPDGAAIAVVVHHACHGTTMGGDNLQITGDWPGAACRHLHRSAVPAEVPILFLQGCCGNINPLRGGHFEMVERHGEAVARAAAAALAGAEAIPSPALGADMTMVSLPVIPPPPVADCRAAVDHWTDAVARARLDGHVGRILHEEGLLEYSKRELAWSEAGYHDPIDFEIQLLSIGRHQVLGMPVEPLVQYAIDFERQASGTLMTLGYSNGVLAYLPTAADYESGGYEVTSAHRYYGRLMFSRECEELVRREAYRLLGVGSPDWTPYSV